MKYVTVLLVTLVICFIPLAINIAFYMLLCKSNTETDYSQKYADRLFVSGIGIISIIAVLIWISVGLSDYVESSKMKIMAIALFLVLWFIAETVVFSIRLKKDGDSLSAWIKRKTSALHKEKITDEEAQKIINKTSNTNKIVEFQALPPEVQSKIIIKCCKKGISVRQLSRFTGVPKGKIKRINKNIK